MEWTTFLTSLDSLITEDETSEWYINSFQSQESTAVTPSTSHAMLHNERQECTVSHVWLLLQMYKFEHKLIYVKFWENFYIDNMNCTNLYN